MKQKKLLIIAATHGDEKIGVEVAKQLKLRKKEIFFDLLVANPEALRLKKRFIEKDLNRVYPGKKYSRFYEKRLAYKNLLVAKNYRYVIDIHEASQGRDDFVIVPKEKLPKKFPLEYINLNKVLLWPDPKGSISQKLNNSIELEFGTKNRNRREVVKKATDIVDRFIVDINSKKIVRKLKRTFYVYDYLEKNELKGNQVKLVDFREVIINREKFLPLLVNQYINNGIVCYKMKSLN